MSLTLRGNEIQVSTVDRAVKFVTVVIFPSESASTETLAFEVTCVSDLEATPGHPLHSKRGSDE